MSDLSSTSYSKDNCNDNGLSPIFMILILLSLCGGNNGILGGCGGSNECGCNKGLDSMLPILILLLSGGSF